MDYYYYGKGIKFSCIVSKKKYSERVPFSCIVSKRRTSERVPFSCQVTKKRISERVPFSCNVEGTWNHKSSRVSFSCSLLENNYFRSMKGNLTNTPGTPTYQEKLARIYVKVEVDCPELGLKYLISYKDVGQVEIETGENQANIINLQICNFSGLYTDTTGIYNDIFNDRIWSSVRQTRKYLLITVYSVCGTVTVVEKFQRMVMRTVTGSEIINISCIDEISDILSQIVNFQSYCFEEVLTPVNNSALAEWEASKAYAAGDLIKLKTIPARTITKNIQIPASYLFQGQPTGWNGSPLVSTTIIFSFTSSGYSVVYYPDFMTDTEKASITNLASKYINQYSTDICFECIQAGTSGATEPTTWPLFSFDKASKNFNYLANTGPLSYTSDIFKEDTDLKDSITDGSCIWKLRKPSEFSSFKVRNLTHKYFDRYRGSQVMVNFKQKYSPDDFLYSENSGLVNFIETIDPQFPVVFVNPISAKWLLKDLFEKAAAEYYKDITITINDKIQFSFEFKDFFIDDVINIQDVEVGSVMERILLAITANSFIEEGSGEQPVLVLKDAVLIKDLPLKADFVIPYEFIGENMSISGGSVDVINCVNVIKPNVFNKSYKVVSVPNA